MTSILISILILAPGILSLTVLGALIHRIYMRRKALARFEQACACGANPQEGWAWLKIYKELSNP